MRKIFMASIVAISSFFIASCGGGSVVDDIADSIRNGVFVYDRNETIVDNRTTEFNLDVTTDIISLTDIDVSLSITHNDTAQLRVYLISPSGRSILLSYQRACGAHNKLIALFDDNASSHIRDYCSDARGKYKPEVALTNFNDEDPRGRWKLRVWDTTAGDSGNVESFVLYLRGIKE